MTVLLTFMLFITPSYAFMQDVHTDITREALNLVTASDVPDCTQHYRSCEDAIEEIARANVNVDSPCLLGGEFCVHEAHCDNELLAQCAKRIFDEKEKLKEFIRQSPPDVGQARQSLGKALHTLQDFYAHSNWVNDKNHTKPHPELGVLALLAKGTVIELKEPTCQDGTVLVNGLTKLLTGFWGSNPAKKCIHGPPFELFFMSSRGIHKDHPGRKLHVEARAVATLATTDYVRLVVQNLKGGDPIRALFGIR